MSIMSAFKPIEGINDNLEVQDLGNLTVDDHNKKTGENLKFVRVVNGLAASFSDPISPLGGVLYELVLEAITTSKINWTYKARVSKSKAITPPFHMLYSFQSFKPVLEYEHQH